MRKEIRTDQLSRKMSVYEANTVLNIVLAVDAEGKPKYTNETMRKAMVTKTLAEDTEYQAMVTGSDQSKKTLARLQQEESITNMLIKKYESYERLYFLDLEKEIK
jgi:hypothetical protein